SQAALDQQKRTLDEEVHHALIEVPVVLLDRLERLGASGGGYEDVWAAELCLGLAVERVDAFRRSHIGADQNALAPRGPALVERALAARLIVVIIEDNLGARLAEGDGHGLAETARAAGDNGDVVFQRECHSRL